MSDKGFSECNVQLVYRDNIESGRQLIESNIEPLAEGKRIEQRDKCKRSPTAHIAHLIKQINAVINFMSDYSKEFPIRHLLSKFEGSLEKISKSNQEYCKFLIGPEEIDNAINAFRNQEFHLFEIAKTVKNFFEECKEFDKNPLIEIFHQKPEKVKPSVIPNQRIVIQNRPYPTSLENLAKLQNLIVHLNHPNFVLIKDRLKQYYLKNRNQA